MDTLPTEAAPLPPWLVDRGALPGHAALVAAVRADLEAEPGAAWLLGPPGAGTTTAAGAVATGWAGPVRAARLAPCRTPADLVLVIGEAVGASPAGDEAAVRAALQALEGGLVVLDDADRPEHGSALDQLRHLAPDLRWLCTGRRAPPGARGHTAAPPPHLAPLALPEARPLPALAELLALTGGSLRGGAGLPAGLALPVAPGRVALRRSAGEAIRARGELEPARVAGAALPDLEPLLALATGAPLRDGVAVDDALVLRWVGEVLADPDASCRASAAAARLLGAFGQQGPALAVLAAADRRNPGAGPGTRALVAWARADLYLDGGAGDAAERAWQEAADLMHRARDLPVLATMLRRQADRLASRGHARRAARAWRTARALSAQLDDPAGVSATVRGAADLAVAQGETLSAAMLYDEAEATSAGFLEAGNRRLGRAGLALAQGDLERARRALEDPDFDALRVPLLTANRDRRRAELALREGRHDRALDAATRAATAYGQLGEQAARARTLRLLGDIHAAAGRPAEAVARWQAAVEAQVRAHDLEGLRRTLHHVAALEEECGSAAVAQELRDAMALLNLATERSASGTLPGRYPPGWSEGDQAG